MHNEQNNPSTEQPDTTTEAMPCEDDAMQTQNALVQDTLAQNKLDQNKPDQNKLDQNIQSRIAERRTFAIISHPDAGKTTLTEKLLLYSGMIRTAGMVRGRKGRKAASSDWMAMEQERGISITASAMQFAYKGHLLNVLDTPGHQDFSEDTYRTLTAADCAIMVLDAAKGVEEQTRKLFQVCRMRNIPILTFINKLDLPGKEPLDLIHEVEEVLGIHAVAHNWPIGSGKTFAGVVTCVDQSSQQYNEQYNEQCNDSNQVSNQDSDLDIANYDAQLFEKTSSGGAHIARAISHKFGELPTKPDTAPLINKSAYEQATFELELLKEAGNKFTKEGFLRGEVTPVFFGSALTNFGLEPFFNQFVELAPCPCPRHIKLPNGDLSTIAPTSEIFSAYVFKIQANMNPKHRDSLAFMRVCSGIFIRDLPVKHHRSGKGLRLSHSHSMLGGERSTLDEAYAGDIIGVINPGLFQIGDTVSTSGGFDFEALPHFPPEVVARIRPKDIGKRKTFDKGMKQLAVEGAVQVLWIRGRQNADPLIAAVGRLQFEVVQHRLRTEYNVDTSLENLPYNYGSWLIGNPDTFSPTTTSVLAENSNKQLIVLYQSEWEKNYILEKNPQHQLVDFKS